MNHYLVTITYSHSGYHLAQDCIKLAAKNKYYALHKGMTKLMEENPQVDKFISCEIEQI